MIEEGGGAGVIGADVPPRRLRPQWLSGVEDTGGASEGLEAVQQVKVEELGGPAFVPNFDGAGWDPLWLPVVASETELFVAGMAGFGDMVKIPLPHHSSGEPHPPLPCGERPASPAGGSPPPSGGGGATRRRPGLGATSPSGPASLT